MKPFSVIKAPLVSEEFFSGVSLMGDSLINAGLAEQLGIKSITQLPVPDCEYQRDPETKIINPCQVHDYSIQIADAVEKDCAAGYFPLLLGGDCTILIGAMLAMKRKGKCGLFFIDGHADFYEPSVSPSGEAADMELGFVVGRGPDIVTNIENRKPLVEETDTVLFGFRDEERIKKAGGQDVRKTKIHCVSLEETRLCGFSNTVEVGIRRLNSVEQFWIHVDVDVLDDAVMPAVDYRMSDGLSVGEMVTTIQRLIKTGRAAGMNISIFNPTLDWDGSLAKKLVAIMAKGLQNV
ncbi:MAG: arginase family protein [Clostridium sp.]|nr:arginase family protein [Clostridium sp.]